MEDLLPSNTDSTKKMDLNSLDLIRYYGSEEKAVQRLVIDASSNVLSFPYQSIFSEAPGIYFQRLKEHKATFDTSRYRVYGYRGVSKLFLPPFFQGAPLCVVGDNSDLDNINILPDLFLEDIRIRGSRKGKPSALEIWHNPQYSSQVFSRALHFPRVTTKDLRTNVQINTKEPRLFRATWIKGIFEVLMSQQKTSSSFWDAPLVRPRILDLSVNWGECLLTAMALDCHYLGFSSQPSCSHGYSAMISAFGSAEHHQIKYGPFDIAYSAAGAKAMNITAAEIVYYQPTLFDEEVGIDKNVTYACYEDWLVFGVFASLMKAWDFLVEGGFLVLPLSDSKDHAACEASNLFIEQFLKGSSHEGVIGVVGEDKRPHPVWIWRKTREMNRRVWSAPASKRPFAMHYPNLISRVTELQLSIQDPALFTEYHMLSQKVETVLGRLFELHPVYTREIVLERLGMQLLRDTVRKYDVEKALSLIEGLLAPWFPDTSEVLCEASADDD